MVITSNNVKFIGKINGIMKKKYEKDFNVIDIMIEKKLSCIN